MRSPDEIQKVIDKIMPSFKSGSIASSTVLDVMFCLHEYKNLLENTKRIYDEKHEDNPNYINFRKSYNNGH